MTNLASLERLGFLQELDICHYTRKIFALEGAGGQDGEVFILFAENFLSRWQVLRAISTHFQASSTCDHGHINSLLCLFSINKDIIYENWLPW